MENIFTTQFGNLSLRFVLKDKDVFVSKPDLFELLRSCSTDDLSDHIEQIAESSFAILGDTADKTGAIVAESTIGPVIHFHAAGNLLHVMSELIDVDNNSLRETAFRIRTFMDWYCEAISKADEYFGRGIMDLLNSVKNRLDRINPALPVHITYSDGIYTAECDDLHLVTEAETIDELQEVVWDLAPDMIEANNLNINPDDLRLSFEISQSAEEYRKTK